MGKLMEVVGKDDDLTKGTTRIKLLETTFKILGKVLGSETGKKWDTLAAGDILSVDALKDLNARQKTLAAKFTPFRTDHNNWVNSKKPIISTLSTIDFSINISDYALAYIPDTTPVSYQQVLNDIAIAERQLYEGTYEDSQFRFRRNQAEMYNWSKTKPYGGCVNYYQSRWVYFPPKAELKQEVAPAHGAKSSAIWDRSSSQLKASVRLTDLHGVPVGATITTRFGYYRYGTRYGYITFDIRRTSLGSVTENDGRWQVTKFSTDVGTTTGSDFYSLNGKPSPHLTTSDANLTLPWFKSRVLL